MSDTPLECPVKHLHPVDPSSRMPTDLNQQVEDPDSANLATTRQESSIPRALDSEAERARWNYPSQRMFYNALRRKGHAVASKDIPTLLHIHNTLNEQVWERLLTQWETLHSSECTKQRTLVRFAGKPGELSWKAWFLGLVRGTPKPFDRHDWIVDRCGRQIRYIIDYYDGTGTEGPGSAAYFVDIRPALDSFGAAWDRIRYAWHAFCNPAPPQQPPE